MRRVIGRIAGPERPPVIVWMRGLNVSVSIAMPRKVFGDGQRIGAAVFSTPRKVP